ncbi:hypothetical protein SUSAZ_03300 [Sulfolobus acidocaldarius SUSAZ]|nr:hypothetical protein SUSAZ_03300 [Sulfolobus acidocaldarius SUSAZ]
MKIYIIDYHKDDPKKCTGKKLIRLGYAKPTNKGIGIVLDPFSETVLGIEDSEILIKQGLTAVDTSWNNTTINEFKSTGFHRRLPILFAGNPTNYALAYRLSTLEAISATLYILEQTELSFSILNTVKWGKTFYELNKDILESYKGKKRDEIIEIENEIIDKIRGA